MGIAVALTFAHVRLHTKALESIRIINGYSQAELARRSGLSQGHISELERGEKRARPATIKKLADALCVPMSSLLTVLDDDEDSQMRGDATSRARSGGHTETH